MSLTDNLPDGVNFDLLRPESVKETASPKAVEAAYEQAFEDGGGAVALEAGHALLEKDAGKCKALIAERHLPTRQLVCWQTTPIPDFLSQHSANGVRELAIGLIKELEAKIKASVDPGVQLEIPQPKGLQRALLKCAIKYGNDPTWLTDADRVTIVSSDVKSLYDTVHKILQLWGPQADKEHVVVVELNDRFVEPMTASYRHYQLLVRIWGVVWEVQINVPTIIKAKHSLGHKAYKTSRYVQEFLLYAASVGDEEGLAKLLALPGVREKADADLVRDHNGLSSLHLAAFNGNLAIIKLLLGCGADPWAVDSHHHYHPLCYALSRRKWPASSLLAKEMIIRQPKSKLFDIDGETATQLTAVRASLRWVAVPSDREAALPLGQLQTLLGAVVEVVDAGSVPQLERAIARGKEIGLDAATCREGERRRPIIILEDARKTLQRVQKDRAIDAATTRFRQATEGLKAAIEGMEQAGLPESLDARDEHQIAKRRIKEVVQAGVKEFDLNDVPELVQSYTTGGQVPLVVLLQEVEAMQQARMSQNRPRGRPRRAVAMAQASAVVLVLEWSWQEAVPEPLRACHLLRSLPVCTSLEPCACTPTGRRRRASPATRSSTRDSLTRLM